MTQPQPIPPAVVGDDDAPLCPHCGYDLRGTAGEICSECGQTVDRAALMRSAIPWASARGLWRIWAYVATVWLITIGSKRLRHEASKPQNLRAAIWFRRITGILVGLSLAGAFVAWWVVVGDLEGLAVKSEPNMNAHASVLGWVEDLLVPWSAGATFPGVLPVLLFGAGFTLVRSHQWIMRIKDATPRRQERVQAVGCYTAAPLAWLSLPSACFMASLASATASGDRASVHVMEAAAVACPLSVLLAFLGALRRIVQVSITARHTGFEHGLFAMLFIPAAWAATLLIWVGLLVWCAGFAWIIIDGFL